MTVYKWLLNCGTGTNNKAELMGVWASLRLAIHLSIQRIQIMGDSRVIIDWLNNKANFHSSSLEGWKDRIKVLINDFQDISFNHVYREYNSEADYLSKMALKEPSGKIIYYQWINGKEGPKNSLNLY
jgi:ribonuclease HI